MTYHYFTAWDVVFFRTQFKCAYCGMKVPSADAAAYLQGKPCF